MTLFAQEMPVIYVEEPGEAPGESALSRRTCPDSGVRIVTPLLPAGLDGAARYAALRALVDDILVQSELKRPVLWHYSPMFRPATRGRKCAAVVYDCMDELANFRFAPPELRIYEHELIAAADVMFTGGHSLFEAKRKFHAAIHAFPSAVDHAHFQVARSLDGDRSTGKPRLGFYGVIDERLDLALLDTLARDRPDWDIEIVGPIAKVSPDDLPRRPNLSYPGRQAYEDLPKWLARWDVALMPFALNESTRFISPTKTPEYLSGGCPVVSTAITDVVRTYGDLEGVRIASAETFADACDAALALKRGPSHAWRDAADALIAASSWRETQRAMRALISRAALDKLEAARPRPTRSRSASPRWDAVVVGAGFAGAVMAERMASDGGKRVLVLDRRPHVAGNAHDRYDAAGILVHDYGPHIFHTNSDDVFAYLSRFTEWRPYEHRVLAEVNGMLVPIPINRTTLNRLYGLDLKTNEEAAAFLATRAEPVARVQTSEDVVVSAVGRELYELFFRGYTRKQWGLDPSELDRSVTARVPTRTSDDDRYFTDTFQAMPAEGYTRMFERMLDHPGIEVRTGTDFKDVQHSLLWDHLVYTGPIDEYFGRRHGRLPYRSLVFRHETLDQERALPTGTVNHPDEATPYTRVSEFKYLTGQSHPQTSVVFEYPSADGDPYYPIPRPENRALLDRYLALAAETPDVSFVGRLASYRYYNMDQVVGQALATWRRLKDVAPAVSRRPERTRVAAAASGTSLSGVAAASS
ncbi:UDP-galactopyranose mutase [Methylobrevis albus]|uniref:UDP-galactopyranose mutase n=1 Tax=Methylobrevis albus TaxID=2793297 RepID=A0A931I3C5_9HYPH|nr:UDP-galactopyranose mutase [Methylobrevis albus]MBH0238520.1 UDP-galactopyranose mutase [Methylobrevis albus]